MSQKNDEEDLARVVSHPSAEHGDLPRPATSCLDATLPEKIRSIITESSIARIAGNIAAGIVGCPEIGLTDRNLLWVAATSVKLAHLIVAELEREPVANTQRRTCPNCRGTGNEIGTGEICFACLGTEG